MSKASSRRRARGSGVRTSYAGPVVARPAMDARTTESSPPWQPFASFRTGTPVQSQPFDVEANPLIDALGAFVQLVEEREDAYRAVVVCDERIRAAVARLRLDGATWVQIGGALGVSRQGARQRFGTATSAADRTRPIHRQRNPTPRVVARSDVEHQGATPGVSEQEVPRWTNSRR